MLDLAALARPLFGGLEAPADHRLVTSKTRWASSASTLLSTRPFSRRSWTSRYRRGEPPIFPLSGDI
jgi:hypothetical protein